MAERPSKRQRQQALLLSEIPDADQTTVVKVGDLVNNSKKPSTIQQTPILDNEYPASLLQNMLFPLAESIFLDKYFRKCAVHVPVIQRESADDDDSDDNDDNDHNTNSRIQCIVEQLADLDPEQLFRETSSESIFCWLRAPAASNNNNNNCTKNLIQSIEVSDPDTALALYRAGNATYCRAPEAVEQRLVSALLENTGLGCGQYEDPSQSQASMTCMGRGEVEVFLSAVAGHLTDWHYDFQENFTMQLSGTKRWTLQKGTVKHPLRGCTPHYESPGTVEPQLKAARLADPNFTFGHPERGVNAEGDVESVLLQPGDVFYFPAGMWHKVEVVEPGVSINISLMATNYATITCQALQHLLLKQDKWREAVVRNPVTGVVDHLKALLKELPQVIKEFEKSGGADWIIPPVLRHGKVTEGPIDDDDDDEEDSDEENGNNQDEDIIDFLKFEPPARKTLPTKGCYVLERNPLASFIPEKNITEFYDGGNLDDTQDEIFVLNVNYAGNESHESSVRVRIKDHEGRLGKLINKFNNSGIANEWIGCQTICQVGSMSPEHTKLHECLIHFGYMKIVSAALR
jgi:hypothetical protein